MKVVFVSNYLNHHQIPFCTYMDKYCDQFDFVASDIKSIQGYQKIENADYVSIYNDKNKCSIMKKIVQADFVIFGSSPHELIHLRMKENKLSYLYSERFYRKGLWRRWNPRTLIKLYDRIIKYRNKNMFVLCASAFLPLDLKLIGFPPNKCFRWGYFPMVCHNDFETLYYKKITQDSKVKILWVGRLIKLKHPEVVIKLSEKLMEAGYQFDLTIIGEGPLRDYLQMKIDKKKLNEYIHIVGSKKQDEVREYMEKSTIFLFTSSKQEGWGAVLNEAMSCGCTPVCSHSIGSVPFLIRNNENGIIYQFGKAKSLLRAVKKLIDNPENCKRMGKKAYSDMETLWNGDIAARRLLQLSDNLLVGNSSEYDSGPCSKASLINEDWL